MARPQATAQRHLMSSLTRATSSCSTTMISGRPSRGTDIGFKATLGHFHSLLACLLGHRSVCLALTTIEAVTVSPLVLEHSEALLRKRTLQVRMLAAPAHLPPPLALSQQHPGILGPILHAITPSRAGITNACTENTFKHRAHLTAQHCITTCADYWHQARN